MDLNYAMAMARGYEFYDTEDLAQEILILSWKLRGNPEGWIRQKCRYYCMDYRRKKWKERMRFISLDEMEPRMEPSENTKTYVNLFLDLIDEMDRPIFKSLSEGYTFKEISQNLNISIGMIQRKIEKWRNNYE